MYTQYEYARYELCLSHKQALAYCKLEEDNDK